MRKILLILLVLTSIVFAAYSVQTITFQGKLLNSIGQPENGRRYMVIRLYNAASGGTNMMYWGLIQGHHESNGIDVDVSDGLYSVELDILGATNGSGTMSDWVGLDDAYLEVWIHNGSTYEKLWPRIHLTAAPYAIQARQLYRVIEY